MSKAETRFREKIHGLGKSPDGRCCHEDRPPENCVSGVGCAAALGAALRLAAALGAAPLRRRNELVAYRLFSGMETIAHNPLADARSLTLLIRLPRQNKLTLC